MKKKLLFLSVYVLIWLYQINIAIAKSPPSRIIIFYQTSCNLWHADNGHCAGFTPNPGICECIDECIDVGGGWY